MRNSLRANSILLFLSGVLLVLGVVGLVYAWPAIFSILCLAVGSVCLITGLYFIYHYRRRIQYLLSNLNRMAKGDFSPVQEDFSVLSRVSSHVLEQLDYGIKEMGRGVSELLSDGREQRQVQSAILEGLNEGVMFCNQQGVILLETPLVHELLAGSKNLIHTTNNEDLVFLRGMNYNHVWSLMVQAMGKGGELTEELNISGDREAKIIEVYVRSLNIRGELGALAVIRDVSHMKQLERMREDFVANVTHELKTPLTSISGYIDLLRSKPRSPEDAEQFYEIIDIEADRLQFLISDLLELSEIQTGDVHHNKNEIFYLYSTVDELFVELEPLASKHQVQLHLLVDPDFQIRANASRMKQLLMNLLSNAIKYNRLGGDVWVESIQERGRGIIVVRDNGIGIPEEDLPRIFERFYRVSKSRSTALGGTGLGLAIVKHIASLYGGSVHVRSVLGEGTSFTITFPQV